MIPVRVTLPELVTVNRYATVDPTSAGPPPFTVPCLSRVIAARCTATGVSVVEAGLVTAGPTGGVPVAVAELCTMPASTSAWVTV